MTKNSVLRTIRISVLSIAFAFLAFSFLSFGVANAQVASPASVSSAISSAHLASNSAAVNISDNQNGKAVFSPNQITVQLGTSLTITNSTKVTQIVVRGSVVIAKLAPGAHVSIMLDKPGFLQFSLLSNANSTLNITVTFG